MYSMHDIFTKETCPDWETFWYVLSNFLDDFKRNPQYNRLAEAPEFLDEKTNAFLAATAEQLAIKHSLDIPEWTYKKMYHLDEPFFPSGLKGEYMIFVLRESPLAFRARNIFVSANVLDRC